VIAVSLPWLPATYRGRLWWVLMLLPLCVVLHPRIMWAVAARVPKLRLVDADAPPPRTETMMKAVGWSLVGWACYGLHVAVLASVFARHGLGTLLAVSTGGYALAWCLGLIVVLLPAGAGARDLSLIAALAAVMPSNPALAVAVISRLVTTAGDLGCAGLAFAASRGLIARHHDELRQIDEHAAGAGSKDLRINYMGVIRVVWCSSSCRGTGGDSAGVRPSARR
jgi:uncharacterized membrane protein YbhN (UPF0104 family)